MASCLTEAAHAFRMITAVLLFLLHDLGKLLSDVVLQELDQHAHVHLLVNDCL